MTTDSSLYEDVIPPSPWLDVSLATLALGGSVRWRRRIRASPADRPCIGRVPVTVLALSLVGVLLSATLLRFGFVDAVLSGGWDLGPYWRVFPAILGETLSLLLLLSVLSPRRS